MTFLEWILSDQIESHRTKNIKNMFNGFMGCVPSSGFGPKALMAEHDRRKGRRVLENIPSGSPGHSAPQPTSCTRVLALAVGDINADLNVHIFLFETLDEEDRVLRML